MLTEYLRERKKAMITFEGINFKDFRNLVEVPLNRKCILFMCSGNHIRKY